MAGVQKILLIGHVGKDPEIITPNGTTLAKFPIAVSESYKNKQGEKVDTTEWFNIEIWGNLASVVEKYVNKGDNLYLECKQKTDVYEKDGVKQYRVKHVANSMTMLGSKNESAPQNKASNTGNNDPQIPDNEGDTDNLPF